MQRSSSSDSLSLSSDAFLISVEVSFVRHRVSRTSLHGLLLGSVTGVPSGKLSQINALAYNIKLMVKYFIRKTCLKGGRL